LKSTGVRTLSEVLLRPPYALHQKPVIDFVLLTDDIEFTARARANVPEELVAELVGGGIHGERPPIASHSVVDVDDAHWAVLIEVGNAGLTVWGPLGHHTFKASGCKPFRIGVLPSDPTSYRPGVYVASSLIFE
jgi:hypothetical protein